MCDFLWIAAPEHEPTRLERAALAGMVVRREPNALLQRQVGPKFATYLLTDGHCSCDYYCERKTTHSDQLRRKYRRLGWSDAKIERAVAAAKSDRDRDWTGLRPDVRGLLASIAHSSERLFLLVTAGSSGHTMSARQNPWPLVKATSDALRSGSVTVSRDCLVEVWSDPFRAKIT